MGKIIDIVSELQKDNPTRRLIDVQIFADALKTYREAADNVRRFGAITAHPRTGAPMENPYLKIQAAKGAAIAKMGYIKSDRVVKLLEGEK